MHRLRGRFEDALECHIESRDINIARGSRTDAAVAQLEIALAHLYAGNWSDAEASLDEAERAFAELAYPRGIIDGKLVRSRIPRRRGRGEEALRVAREAFERADEISYKRGSVLAQEEIGDIAFEAERWAEARRTFSQALRDAMEIEPEGDLVYELSWRLGRLELRRGDPDRADELAWTAIRLAEQSADRRELGHALLTLAMVRAAQDDEVEVESLTSKALQAFRDVRTPYELAHAYELCASLLQQFPGRPVNESSRHLLEAATLYERVGADQAAQRARSRARAARTETSTPAAEAHIVTDDPLFLEVLKTARDLGRVDATVLIEGETGTGKELVARLIHESGRRKDGRFVAVNCAAVARDLLASELFGHRKGAFTGAAQDRDGLLVAASGGTILLDEVDKASPEFQASLLRVLEDGVVRPVGGSETTVHDARILCASNRDLEKLAGKGTFLPDLYYRLGRFRLQIPSLRERRDDIPLLTRHFLRDCVGTLTEEPVDVSREALGRLLTYGWPGNVRELQNVVGSCAFFAREAGIIDVAHLPESIATPLGLTGDSLTDEIAQLERGRILRALKKAKGVKTDAARALGISRKGLRDRIRRLGLGADSQPPA